MTALAFQLSGYTLLYVAAGSVSAVAAFSAFRIRRAPGGWWLFLMSVATAVWSLADAVDHSAVALAVHVLVDTAVKTHGIYRTQGTAIVVGALLPWAGGVVYLAVPGWLVGLDPALTFTVTGAILTWTIWRLRLLDLVLVPREVIVEQMADGLIVLDSATRILEINPAAVRLLDLAGMPVPGTPALEVFSDWSQQGQDAVTAVYEQRASNLTSPAGTLLRVERSRLEGGSGGQARDLFLLRDITGQVEAEQALQGAYADLRARMDEIQKLHGELQEQATRDPLTGLHNRRYLAEELGRELGRAARDRSPVSVIMLDVDHFKDINDSYGHSAGDAMLRAVAVELLVGTRRGDIACRYGGDEFVVVLPDTTGAVALARAEGWRARLSQVMAAAGTERVNVTVSLGVATFPHHGSSIDACDCSRPRGLRLEGSRPGPRQRGRGRVRGGRPRSGHLSVREKAADRGAVACGTTRRTCLYRPTTWRPIYPSWSAWPCATPRPADPHQTGTRFALMRVRASPETALGAVFEDDPTGLPDGGSMSSTSHVTRRPILAIAALAVVLAALLCAPATSFAAGAPLRPATKGVGLFVKSADAARADTARFLQTLRAGGAFTDWRGAAASQIIPVQGPDGSVAVFVVTLTAGGRYAGYATIDALPSLNPVLAFSRNPAPVFPSDSAAQARVGTAKGAPRVKRQVYTGPLSYGVETVAATGVTETVPTGALMQATSSDAVRGPPVAAAGAVAVSSIGTAYKMIANMPDYDQFSYNYTSSEYNAGTIPVATGAYASSPYLNAGGYYSGCAPTAAGDVVGYWASAYPKLLTGRTPAQGGAAWQKLVNDLHIYFHCKDVDGGGSTYSNDVAPGLTRYAQGVGGYSFSSSDTNNFSWTAYTGEIDANRPVVLMFQNLNVTAPKAFPYGSHAITGVGYDHTPGSVSSEYMIVHDNWPAYTSDDVYVQFSGPNATYDSREMVTFMPAAAPAAPANDAFDSAQALSGSGGSFTGTNVSATKESGEPSHAAGQGTASVWYRWTASATGTLTVDTFGSGFDTALAAYTGTSLSALTAVASNNDVAGHGTQSRIAFHVTGGTTYRIAVDGWAAGIVGAVNLDWTFAAPPVLPDIVTAAIDSAAPSPEDQGVAATFSGHAIDSLGHAISAYEWTSSVDGVISTSASFTTTALSPGTHTIGFRAMCANGMWSARQTVTLSVTGLPSAPANDVFDDAQPLSGTSGTVSGKNVGATKQTGEPGHAGDPGGASVWYEWVAPATGMLSVDTSGSDFDTILAAYTGSSVSGLTVRASASSDVLTNVSRISLAVVAGTRYRIAVDGYGGASGDVQLNWSFRAPAPSAMTVRLDHTSLTRYHYVTITGTFRPRAARESVRVEILKPGSHTWLRVARTTNSSGTWTSLRYKVLLKGTYRVRTRFLGDARYTASTSVSARLVVR